MFHAPALPSKQAGHGRRARSEAEARLLLEAPSGMREHRVDLAGVGGEIVARHRRTALAARHVVDEPLELVDVLLHGLPELGVAAILAADFLECLMPLSGVEAAAEQAITLAALVALPQLGRGVVVDHAGDVDRERFERVDGVTLCARRGRSDRRAFVARGARQDIAEPAAV